MDELILEKKQAINNIIAALSEQITSEKVKLSQDNLDSIKVALDSIFENGNCKRVLYTVNTDKVPFGIYINHCLNQYTVNQILFDNVPFINDFAYEVEIDSKLFDLGFTPEEVTEILIHDVNIAISNTIFTKLRNIINVYALHNMEYIDITNNKDQKSILLYGFKDTLYKLYSSLYGNYDDPDSVLNLDTELQDKISKTYYNNSSIFDNFPKVIILQWAFMVYKDIKHYGTIAKEALTNAKAFTGSVLIKKEIDSVLAALSRVDMTITESTSFSENKRYIDNLINSVRCISEGSIFKALKVNGLRAIENDYYEYAILVKSASDENEAMYALRGINTRISILSDYIYNTNISDAEKKHWEDVIALYQDLRVKLTKKNIINKKQYGLFFDYSQLDNLDKKEND